MQKLLNANFFGLFILVLIFSLSSCDKEEEMYEGSENFTQQQTGEDGTETELYDEDCFSFVFPIQVQFDDETTVEILNEEELYQLEEDLEDGGTPYPSLVFPVEIILDDDSQQTIGSETEFQEIIESCESSDTDGEDEDEDYGDEEDEDEEEDEHEEEDQEDECDENWEDYLCFDFVYPIEISVESQETTTIGDREELLQFLEDMDWELEIIISYPVSVVLEDGTEVEVLDDEQLEDLFDACEYDDEEECLSLVFPVELQLPNGDVLVIDSEEQLEDAYDNWEEENPDTEEEPMLIFPVEIINADGTTTVINSYESLEEIDEICGL